MTAPSGMNDMTSWRPVSCFEADAIRRQGAGLSVASTLTDPEAQYGPAVVFTEWWWIDTPVLREYRYPGQHGADDYHPCQHWLATSLDAATPDDEDDE